MARTGHTTSPGVLHCSGPSAWQLWVVGSDAVKNRQVWPHLYALSPREAINTESLMARQPQVWK